MDQAPTWSLVRLLLRSDGTTILKPMGRVHANSPTEALAEGRALYPLIPRHELAIDLPQGEEDV